MSREEWVAQAQELDGSWTTLKTGTLRQVLRFLARFREQELDADRVPPETRARPTGRAHSSRNQKRRKP